MKRKLNSIYFDTGIDFRKLKLAQRFKRRKELR